MIGAFGLEPSDLAARRSSLLHSMLKPAARPVSEVQVFRSAIPSPEAVGTFSSGSWHADKARAACKDLAQWQGRIGLLVVNGKPYQVGNAGKDLAQAIFALGFDAVAGYGCIVGLLVDNLDPEKADEHYGFDAVLAGELGIDVVYDPDGYLGEPVDVTEGTVSIGSGTIVFDRLAVSNTRVDELVRSETRIALVKAASAIAWKSPRNSYLWDDSWETGRASMSGFADVERAVDGMTGGKWNVERFGDGGEDLPRYKLPSYRLGSSVTGLVDEGAVRMFNDICAIWKETIAQFGLDFDLTRVMASGKMAELAEGLGIDSAVDAYLAGVPLEDVLPRE